MKNNKTLALLGLGILFISFNTLSLLFGVNYSITFWSALVFVNISFLITAGVLIQVVFSDKPIKQVFYRLSLVQLTYQYFIAQFILSVIVMLVNALDSDSQYSFVALIGALISFILLVLIIVKLISALIGVNTVESIDSKVEEKIQFTRTSQSLIDNNLHKISDKVLKVKFEKLSEDIRFSDPMGNESTRILEVEILDSLLLLNNEILKEHELKDIQPKVSRLITQRNGILKDSK